MRGRSAILTKQKCRGEHRVRECTKRTVRPLLRWLLPAHLLPRLYILKDSKKQASRAPVEDMDATILVFRL